MLKNFIFAVFVIFCVTGVARADIAAATYVDSAIKTKVDTSVDADQELAGKYVVTGTLEVPDAPLPSAN